MNQHTSRTKGAKMNTKKKRRKTRVSMSEQLVAATAVLKRARALTDAAYSPLAREPDPRLLAAALDETLVALDLCDSLERRSRGASRLVMANASDSLARWADKIEDDLSMFPVSAPTVLS